LTTSIVISLLMLLSGCAAEPLAATGGSKSDGTVVFTSQYGAFQKPPPANTPEELASAIHRCNVWGYSGAEPFDVVKARCVLAGGFGGCAQFQEVVTYQCTGGK
jgi:hypothetical protein